MEWIYTEICRVDENSGGFRNFNPVLGYCSCMEGAAERHAERLGVAVENLRSEGMTWVLAKLCLVIDALPAPGADMLVRTWPVGAERAQFRRDFLITDLDGNSLARAVTDWVVFNLKTRRLEKMPAFISKFKPENPEHALEKEKLNFPGQGAAPELGRFIVRPDDIDGNEHVNNIRFMDWMIRSMPAKMAADKTFSCFQVIFKSEALLGDTVIARGSWGTSGNEFLHGLFRERDGLELVRGRSIWK